MIATTFEYKKISVLPQSNEDVEKLDEFKGQKLIAFTEACDYGKHVGKITIEISRPLESETVKDSKTITIIEEELHFLERLERRVSMSKGLEHRIDVIVSDIQERMIQLKVNLDE